MTRESTVFCCLVVITRVLPVPSESIRLSGKKNAAPRIRIHDARVGIYRPIIAPQVFLSRRDEK